VASAAEVPPLTVSGVRPECAAPTGLPGEIVTTIGRDNDQAAQLVTATQAGMQPGPTLRPDGYVAGCAVAASQPNGAAVLAIPTDSGLFVSLREPGGTWGEMARFPGGGYFSTGYAAAAVSEAGDALVVWQTSSRGRRVELYAARRLAGGTFSPPVTLANRANPVGRETGGRDWFAAGIANGGEAVVTWTDLPTERPPHRADVKVAIAPASGTFGASVKVGRQTGYSTPSFAMRPDGHALLTLAGLERVQIAERTAGAPFGAPATLAKVSDPLGVRTDTALGAGGQAVVAWSGTGLGGVRAAIRRDGGPFSGALPTAGADKRLRYDVWSAVSGDTQDLPADTWGFGGAGVRARVANGVALLGWVGPRGLTRAANLATYPLVSAFLGAGSGVRQTIGGELVDAWYSFPLALADGTVALAWYTSERLHLATGAAADTTALPEVRVSTPGRVVKNGNLVLPFHCSAACEIRAQLVTRHGYEDIRRLGSAGTGRLRLTDVDAPSRLGNVRVRFTVGTADGRRSRSWTATYRLRADRGYRLVRVEPVRAVRTGDRVRVTLSLELEVPIEDALPAVVGGFDRRGNVEPLVTSLAFLKKGQRTASATLPAKGVRWVSVLWGGERKFVRVR
jgi:hypothetical protein